jgi:ppGpp synthetase/RelA/SpoT-type nucleotidyltranferase
MIAVHSSCLDYDDDEACDRALEEVAWAIPKNSIQEINEAGRVLAALPGPNGEGWNRWLAAYDVLNQWRAAHSYPLNIFQNNLRKSARKLDSHALIAQRIKRLFSVRHKLVAHEKMKLSQMQDIGGCRAVLADVSTVRRLAMYYEKDNRMKHPRSAKDDYIASPKPSGYRGVHLIYRYFSDKGHTQVYNGLKIEMQLRSQFQHAWATAVETVGTFVGQALKSSIGDEEWKRFFALMGSAIAMREEAPIVRDTPTRQSELRHELAELAGFLNVQARLQAYGDALRAVRQREEKANYYLLELDITTSELTVTGFLMNEVEEAESRYKEVEKSVQDNQFKDAVLVSVDSLSSLERAYPNYFADTRMFVQLLTQELSGRPKRIQVPALDISSS